MNEHIFELAKNYVENNFCSNCKSYSFCHTGENTEFNFCKRIQIYEEGYSQCLIDFGIYINRYKELTTK